MQSNCVNLKLNRFLNFHDNDVLRVKVEPQFSQFHSLTLKHHSELFK